MKANSASHRFGRLRLSMGRPWPTVKVSIFPQLQHPIACTIASYLASTMARGKIGADGLNDKGNSTSICDDPRPLQNGAWRYSTLRRQPKITPMTQPVAGIALTVEIYRRRTWNAPELAVTTHSRVQVRALDAIIDASSSVNNRSEIRQLPDV